DYARQPLLMKQLSQLGPGVAWFDLDADGHDDLFIGSGKGGQLSAFRNDGRGGFTPIMPTNVAPIADDLAGLASWVTSDGKRLLLAAQASYESSSRAAVPAATSGVSPANPSIWQWQLN